VFSDMSFRFRSLFRRTAVECELDDELRFHLDHQVERYVAAGMTRAEALRRTRLEFGGLEQVKEDCREARGVSFVETLGQDLRFGLRTLRKAPGFSMVTILTLALGIGMSAAIFSVVNAILLRPLAYPSPRQLVFVSQANAKARISDVGMSYPTFSEFRDHNRVFRAMAGLAGHALTLTGSGEPSEVNTVVVTEDFFAVFGTRPLLGRTLLADDGKRGAAPVVVLSERLWRSRFGGDADIVGRSITLDQRPFTVVGVMPADFRTPFFGQANQEWIPLAQDPVFSAWMTRPPQDHWMPVIARLRPGVSFSQAKAELDTLSAAVAKKYPKENGWLTGIQPLQKEIVGDVQSPLLILLGAVGFLLLIACVNIANLLLTRATARQKEMAVRIALGADRRRIAWQLLTECSILGLAGGIAGVVLAWGGVSAMGSLLPSDLPQIHSIRVDGFVLGFALVLSLAASLLFGLAPVLFAARSHPQTDLRESARAGQTRGSQRARGWFAVAEIALAMILLVGGGLLMRSFLRLMSVDPGFEPDHVVKAEVSLPQFQYRNQQQWAEFLDQLLSRLEAQPGLRDTAMAAPLPISDPFVVLPFAIAGSPPPAQGQANTSHWTTVSPRYFEVMRIPLLRGRLFAQSDSMTAPPVAVISEALARKFFPDRDPLGQHLIFGFPPNGNVSREIVGVVSDIRDASLADNPGPMMYVPIDQDPIWGGEVVVRSGLSESAVVAAIRTETHRIDKNLPVTNIETLPDAVHASMAEPRFHTELLGLFGSIALLLAGIGIFGVMSFSVSRRTQEIGTRMALGATRASIWRLVIGESAKLVSLGLAVGIPAALLLTRYLSTLLFAVHPSDPLTFVVVAILLTLVALAAAYFPARRAMRVDPIVALRCE
jgi:predicted permease